MNIIDKLADQAIRHSGKNKDDYVGIINDATDKEAFALAISKLDEEIMSPQGDFAKWRNNGYSRSKRAARVMNQFVSEMKTPAAKEIIEAKRRFLYSVCESQNIESTNMYKSVRAEFLREAKTALKML